jgi:hypothetical protein
MLKIFRFNVGTYLAFAYLILLMWVWLEININPPDAQSGIAIILLTLPWSFILLDLAERSFRPPDVMYLAAYVTVFSILLNMTIFHFCGAVLTALGKRLFKKKNLI